MDLRKIAVVVSDYYASNKTASDGTFVIGASNVQPRPRINKYGVRTLGGKGKSVGPVSPIVIAAPRIPVTPAKVSVEVVTLPLLKGKDVIDKYISKKLRRYAEATKSKVVLLKDGKVMVCKDPKDLHGELIVPTIEGVPVVSASGNKPNGRGGRSHNTRIPGRTSRGRFHRGLVHACRRHDYGGGECYSIITGPEVVTVTEKLPVLVGIQEFVDEHTSGTSVSVMRRDLEGIYELKHGGDGEGDSRYPLLMEFISNFYLDFNASEYEDILLEKNKICLLSKNINRRMNIHFNAVNPEAFVVTLYVVHLALVSKWNDNDKLKDSLLRNFLTKEFPKSLKYIDDVRKKIENISPRELLRNHNKLHVGSLTETTDDYVLRTDMPKCLIEMFRKHKVKQETLCNVMKKFVLPKIKESKRKTKGLKWYHVLELMKQLKLFREDDLCKIDYNNFGSIIASILQRDDLKNSVKSGCYREPDKENRYDNYDDLIDDLKQTFLAYGLVNPCLVD